MSDKRLLNTYIFIDINAIIMCLITDEWPNLLNESVPPASTHKGLCYQTRFMVSRKFLTQVSSCGIWSLQIVPYCTDTGKHIRLLPRHWTAEGYICLILRYHKLNIVRHYDQKSENMTNKCFKSGKKFKCCKNWTYAIAHLIHASKYSRWWTGLSVLQKTDNIYDVYSQSCSTHTSFNSSMQQCIITGIPSIEICLVLHQGPSYAGLPCT